MRTFGLICLLIVMGVMLWLSTRQIAFVAPDQTASTPANVRIQSQQIENQVRQKLQEAMQQSPRDVPDEAR